MYNANSGAYCKPGEVKGMGIQELATILYVYSIYSIYILSFYI